MAVATIQSVLPVLAAGLPREAECCLRAAGLPVESYRPGTSIRDFLDRSPGRYVLYDSRRMTSRAEAETAQSFDREIVDLAPAGRCGLPDMNDSQRQSAATVRWIEAVKRCLEERGGLWGRIHDLPYGYEAVVLPGDPSTGADGDPLAQAFDLLSARTPVIQPPHFGVAAERDHGDQTSAGERSYGCWWHGRLTASELLSDGPGLRVWRPSVEEFRAWWKWRADLRVTVHRTHKEVRITSQTELEGGWTPAFELWRGDHVARFPLDRPATVAAYLAGMVYAQESYRHPAGLILSRGNPAARVPSPRERMSSGTRLTNV